jgi:hypothetical protein
MWKLHDAGQSFLLQGSGTNKYRSAPGAGYRADSSSHNCCDTAGRLVRGVDFSDGPFPSFVSSRATSRTISRLQLRSENLDTFHCPNEAVLCLAAPLVRPMRTCLLSLYL